MMPSGAQILAGLTAIANDWQWLAVAWHLYLGAIAVALLIGRRPSLRLTGSLLALPLLSVGLLAWLAANPFNGTLFFLAGSATLAIAVRLPPTRVRPAPAWATASGAALFGFGWVYPHFLDAASPLTYLYAAPLGLIPCPTLAAVTGLGLILGGLQSRAWSLVVGAMGLFYGLFGALRLGVTIDWVLFGGALLATAQALGAGAPAGAAQKRMPSDT